MQTSSSVSLGHLLSVSWIGNSLDDVDDDYAPYNDDDNDDLDDVECGSTATVVVTVPRRTNKTVVVMDNAAREE